MKTNVDYSWSKLNTLLSIRGGDKLLTLEEIAQLKDGDIVFVQWPTEEGITPYKIKTKPLQGYGRPWIYATDIHPYQESPCLWQREISGFGQFIPGKEPYDLRVWVKESNQTNSDVMLIDKEEVFATIIWYEK